MKFDKCLFKLQIKRVNYALSIGWYGRIWLAYWLPTWHDGRGKYLTVGFYFIRFIRGY